MALKAFLRLKKENDHLIQTKFYSMPDVWFVMGAPSMYNFSYPFGM